MAFSKKKIISVLLLLILLISMPVGMYLAKQAQTGRSRASEGASEFDIHLDPRLGVAFVASTYPSDANISLNDSIQDTDFIVKGARDARKLGFQSIEIYATPDVCRNKDTYHTTDWGDCSSPSKLLSDSRYQTIFNLPFKTYFISIEPFSTGAANPDLIAKPTNYDSNNPATKNNPAIRFNSRQLELLYGDFKDAALFILNNYKETNKVFIIYPLSEMDWHLVKYKGMDQAMVPDELAIQNAIDYWNTVQRAINDAKTEANVQGVKLYQGCEVNFVTKAFRGVLPNDPNNKKTAINDVIPHTNCDLYGLSAYDAVNKGITTYQDPNDPNTYRNYIVDTLEYINSKTRKSNPDFPNKNVYISEVGFPENEPGASGSLAVTIADETIRQALDWGVPYLVYWELYDNECKILKGEGTGDRFAAARPPLGSYSASYMQDYLHKYAWYFEPLGIRYDATQNYRSHCPGFYIRKPDLNDPNKPVDQLQTSAVYNESYRAKYLVNGPAIPIPVGVPGNLQVTCDGNNARVSWTAPSNASVNQEYEVQYNGYRWRTPNLNYSVTLNSGARVNAQVGVKALGNTSSSAAIGTINCPEGSNTLIQLIIQSFGNNSSSGDTSDTNNDGKLNELDFGAVYSH